MKKSFWFFFAVKIAISLTVLLSFSNKVVFALSEEDLPFRIYVLPNEYQAGGVGAYYKWGVLGGETIEGGLFIENVTSRPIEVVMDPVNALTSSSGGIDYTQKTAYENGLGKHLDEKYLFMKYIQIPKSVYLKPKEKKKITFTVHVPKLEGDLIGGIRFYEQKGKPQTNASGGGGLTIHKQFHQVIAVHLDYKKKSQPRIEVPSIQAANTPHGNEIRITIQNPSHRLIENFKGTAILTDKATGKQYDIPLMPFNVAPTTEFSYILPMDSLEKGTYDIKFQYQYNGKTYQKKETVEISQGIVSAAVDPKKKNVSKENKDFKQEKVKTETHSIYLWLWLLIGIMIGFGLCQGVRKIRGR